MPARLLYLILVSACIRLVVAAYLELSNDEVYYYLYALDLKPNYFDHPPAVGLLIRLTTLNLAWVSELSIRLGAIVCSATGTWIMYKLGRRISGEQTGWLSAVLYNTSIYASLIAGTFIIPDSPQIICWLSAVWCMLEILSLAHSNQDVPMRLWLLFGFLAGLTVLCKVHGVFLWLGLGLFILLFDRKLLQSGGLYLAALLTMVLISPIIWWNIKNDFITFRFHGGRVAIQESILHPDYFFQTVGGQFLYNNPINVVLIILGLWKLNNLRFLNQFQTRFILLNSVPIILVVTGMSLFTSMLPHWSGPGFVILCLLAAAYIGRISKTPSALFPGILKYSIGLILVPLLIAFGLILHYPGTIGSQKDKELGADDFTLDMYGWHQFADDLAPWLKEQEEAQIIPPHLPIVVHKWFPGAHIEYYIGRMTGKPVIGVGLLMDLHQYYWLNSNRPTLKMGDDAIGIVPTNYAVNIEQTYGAHFDAVELLKVFDNYRGGKVARQFEVYRLKGYQGNDELHTLTLGQP